ncbi:MAG: dockerin type I repeat-containing protein [Alistipes sp.]|nr:dockerin type I repeat-containing protein [Alistipes sp.]
MKSYEDIAERVFKRGDELLERKQRRASGIKRVSCLAAQLCAVLLICLGVRGTSDIDVILNNNYPDMNIPVTAAETETSPQTTTAAPGTSPYHDTSLQETAQTAPAPGTATAEAAPAVQTQPHSQGISADTEARQTQTALETKLHTNEIPPSTTVCTAQTETEGRIYMKKIAALGTSALLIAASASPIIGSAEYKIDESRYWAGEKAIFAKMESGELDLDINGDGAFDVLDGFKLFCYTFEKRYCQIEAVEETIEHIYASYSDRPELAEKYAENARNYFAEKYKKLGKIDLDDADRERIEAIADYNGDGVVNFQDSEHLERYLIINGGVKRAQLNPTFYDPDFPMDDFSTDYNVLYNYIKELEDHLYYLRAGYDIFAEMYEDTTGEWNTAYELDMSIDLDFNGNGQLDIGDLYVFYVFEYLGTQDKNKGYISNEEWKRCDTAMSHCPGIITEYCVERTEDNGLQDCYRFTDTQSRDVHTFRYYLTHYIVEHIEMRPEYFTEEYYIKTYGSSYYRPDSGIINYLVEQAAARLGLRVDDDAWLKYNIDDLNELFLTYCDNVDAGLTAAPDVNMDGAVDLYDYFTINTYMKELINGKTAADSALPAEIWNNIEEGFDINGNGTTKDIYDILAVQMYVIKHTDTSDFDEVYSRYQASLEGAPALEAESKSYDQNLEILAEMESKTLYGDANCDGEVDISDATLVLQHIGNGDKYQLSAQEKRNADCCDPGDGITALDALAIQSYDAGNLKSLPSETA